MNPVGNARHESASLHAAPEHSAAVSRNRFAQTAQSEMLVLAEDMNCGPSVDSEGPIAASRFGEQYRTYLENEPAYSFALALLRF
jgi:hypothetical protein